MALAAAPGPDNASRPFDVWDVGGDMEQNPITTVVQSRQGYLWLGTYTGLIRFDGVRETVFDSANTAGLRNSRVTSLYETADSVLWIGHETGEVTRYSDGEFQPAGRLPAWPGGAVEAITSDESRDLWLMNDTGFLLRMRDGRTLEPLGGGSASRKVGLSRDRNGKLWVTANGKLAYVEHGELVPYAFDDNAGTNFFERVAPARDGGLWVLANGRLRKWNEGRWVADLGLCPCEAGYVTEVFETRSGRVLAGTVKDGLYLVTPGAEPLHFARTNGLSHDWVRSLCEDHEGNIWVATGSGLNALRPRKVQMLSPPDECQGRAVLSFALGPTGDAWVGSEGAGLYHYEENRWNCFTENSGLANLFVWSVLQTRQGDLFVGTWGGGLMVRKGERFEAPGELGRVTAPVVSLYEGSKGELWIGTTIGLSRFQAGKVTSVAEKEKLVSPDVRAITEAADGTLWFGMLGGGLGRFKDGTLKQFRKEDGLNSDFVLALYAEPDGTLWIGTSDNGLCRLREGKFATISTPQGLLASIVSQIVEDGAGNLWLGSHRGILRVSKADLNRCADGEAQTVNCLSYAKAEGLASQKCSGGFQPGVCRGADGRLWFPTAKGLAIIDPRSFTTNTVPPPVVIEELLVEGQPVSLRQALADASAQRANGKGQMANGNWQHELRIPAGKQRFELHYTALSFAAPDKVRFKHKLEGLEDEWVDDGTKRVMPYTYLPPGPYTFRVVACNNDGVWSDHGAALSFTVLPQLWQTWWFKGSAPVAGGGVVAALAIWVARRRARRHLERLERQQAIERERARIARDIHDDLGASLTRISLLSQTALGDLDDSRAAAADVNQIYTTARELTRAMDEIVWAVNPQHDTLDSLVAYLGRYAQSFLSAAAIRCRIDVPMHLPHWPLTAEIRHNTFLAFKEALNNVVKHAQATEVRVSLEVVPQGFSVMVADNGRGFDTGARVSDPQRVDTPSGVRSSDPQHAGAPGALPMSDGVGECCGSGEPRSASNGDESRSSSGNGLLNMRKRLEEIGGRCELRTSPGEGTRARLVIPVKA